MAGPIATVLLSDFLGEEGRSGVRSTIKKMSDEISGNDFWYKKMPFILSFGEDRESEFEKIANEQFLKGAGWSPVDAISFSAMCNQRADHFLLAELCLVFARSFDSLVDFGGVVFPRLLRDLDSLSLGEHHITIDGAFDQAMFDLKAKTNEIAGELLTIPYSDESGHRYLQQYCDAEFLSGWIQHPEFHMIK